MSASTGAAEATNPAMPRARKERRLVDVRVRCEFPDAGRWLPLWFEGATLVERRAEAVASAVESFQEFLRDHRSQDNVTFEVERIHLDVCSACGRAWEVADGACAYCGVAVESDTPTNGGRA